MGVIWMHLRFFISRWASTVLPGECYVTQICCTLVFRSKIKSKIETSTPHFLYVATTIFSKDLFHNETRIRQWGIICYLQGQVTTISFNPMPWGWEICPSQHPHFTHIAYSISSRNCPFQLKAPAEKENIILDKMLSQKHVRFMRCCRPPTRDQREPLWAAGLLPQPERIDALQGQAALWGIILVFCF